jgi:uncharacterized protein (DUF4415 family)
MTGKKTDEAEIQAMIASDPDAPEATDEQLAAAQPFPEAYPALAKKMRRAAGRPKLDEPKVPVSIRLDADVLRKWKATGPGWQSRINEALKTAKP